LKKTTFVLMLLVAAGAPAATIEVSSLMDDADGTDGECTLREAITAANTNSASGAAPGECVAGSGTVVDVIELPAPLAGTISLGSSLPTVTEGLELNGPADRSIVVSGFGFDPLVVVDASPTVPARIVIRRLTFSGDSAITVSAGSLYVAESLFDGISIFTTTGVLLVMTNSTVSGVSSSGSGAVGAAEAVLIHTTVTESDLGLKGNITLVNSVVSGNTDDCDLSTSIRSLIGSFVGDASCGLGIPASGDAMLLALADNGGPTRTHGLDVGSPLRDAADNGACVLQDQRGGDRPLDGDGVSGGVCDVGAVEVTELTTPVELESFYVE
jgi:CSLREA domain-containing protein